MNSKFKLTRKSANRLKVTYHVINQGDVIGSISIAPSEENDLLRCWSGAADRREQSPQLSLPIPQRMSRTQVQQAILRGC